MSELTDQTYDTICRLCEQGDTLADDGQYAEALDLYRWAWDLLPEPKTDWESEDLLQILADHSARTAADEGPSENT
ncbi:hypothetical protein [Neisseria elongata]|uniref:hypothetical protein n=1 Tax=Neisseria elongata TaxID=495 RepID=UPI0024B0E635|nr:hypothetical protein [Neisseria elongata]